MYGDRDDLELQRLLRDAVERRREIVENKHARVCFEERLARDFFAALCDKHSRAYAGYEELVLSFSGVP